MTSEKLDGLSMDVEAAEREKLKVVFPQCFTDGKLDIDQLLNLCGEYITDDFEKYEFKWKGKSECVQIAGKRSFGTLRPCEEESVDFATTKNLYLEGDNLEVLKLLQSSYFNRVKMIYIDPPYNTGNDFVYEDDFSDPLNRYREVTKQTTKSNPENMGRFHTNWLNMMWPRLRMAANLLRDDGVVFISIDDNEVHNLRKLCDEIFGEENFRNQIIVRRGAKSVQAQFDTWDKLGQDSEYILFYTKNANYRFPKQMKKLSETRAGTWNNHWRGTDRRTMRYAIFGIEPESGQWRWGEERSLKAIENYKQMLVILNETEENITQEKIDAYYLTLDEPIDLLRLSKTGKPEHYIPPTDYTLLNSSWYDLLIGSSSEISDLFGRKVFDTAKLTTVITRMINFCDKDDIILDFFSGSATTAHAVMQLNAEDGGNRRFICVQLPELCDEKSEAYKAGYHNICEIGKERIRRAGAKIKASMEPEADALDVGFRVFKLDSSNLKIWDDSPVIGEDAVQRLEQRLWDYLEVLIPGRTDEDLVYEIVLKLGQDLCLPIVPIDLDNERKVYGVGEDIKFIVCLAKNITTDDAQTMASFVPGRIVFAEQCFNATTDKSNVRLVLKDKGITIKTL